MPSPAPPAPSPSTGPSAPNLAEEIRQLREELKKLREDETAEIRQLKLLREVDKAEIRQLQQQSRSSASSADAMIYESCGCATLFLELCRILTLPVFPIHESIIDEGDVIEKARTILSPLYRFLHGRSFDKVCPDFMCLYQVNGEAPDPMRADLCSFYFFPPQPQSFFSHIHRIGSTGTIHPDHASKGDTLIVAGVTTQPLDVPLKLIQLERDIAALVAKCLRGPPGETDALLSAIAFAGVMTPPPDGGVSTTPRRRTGGSDPSDAELQQRNLDIQQQYIATILDDMKVEATKKARSEGVEVPADEHPLRFIYRLYQRGQLFLVHCPRRLLMGLDTGSPPSTAASPRSPPKFGAQPGHAPAGGHTPAAEQLRQTQIQKLLYVLNRNTRPVSQGGSHLLIWTSPLIRASSHPKPDQLGVSDNRQR
ncbi:hypothetical protein PAPYR_8425 [Paratrimastix pyriformis]|uniref:Uncharacterized protein n=1 Tax=Paratrimastix pyriformis TaxID=342808 RepID=A0ABQ8UAQ4_9EUKA|nr:hypothetical protein PAPYR_8425 [Paratrimastix pyriformis]